LEIYFIGYVQPSASRGLGKTGGWVEGGASGTDCEPASRRNGVEHSARRLTPDKRWLSEDALRLPHVMAKRCGRLFDWR
jgi:hypothetical protein